MTRDQRIAHARLFIAGCLRDDEQLDPEHYAVVGFDTLAEFRALVPNDDELAPTSARAIQLNHRIADAIMHDAGFASVSYLPPVERRDGYLCTIRVPVGAP